MTTPLDHVTTTIKGHRNLIDVATALGELVLDDESVRYHHRPRANEGLSGKLGAMCAALPADMWLGVDTGQQLIAAIGMYAPTGSDLGRLVEQCEIYPELATIGCLRGLCDGALRQWFAATDEEVALRRGTPHPVPMRPLLELYGRSSLTPNPSDANSNDPLYRLGYRLHASDRLASSEFTLDFSHALVIDELCWAAESIPPVATIHPFGKLDELDVAAITATTFFGVAPKVWDNALLTRIAHSLRLARDAGAAMAVLPELVLPTPDALGRLLAAAPKDAPRLVVAGSAHVDEGSVRANEVRAYLDGKEVLRYRKMHAFKAKAMPPEVLERLEPAERGGPWIEDVTTEARVVRLLCGRSARLGIAICADLNDSGFRNALGAVAVNQLLVPSLTDDPGAFEDASRTLASDAQAVVVIANGTLVANPADAFLAYASVPLKREPSAFYTPTASRSSTLLATFSSPGQAKASTPSWSELSAGSCQTAGT